MSRLHPNARRCSNRLIELVDDGILDKHDLIISFIGYLSESQVEDFCETNDIRLFEEEEEEE